MAKGMLKEAAEGLVNYLSGDNQVTSEELTQTILKYSAAGAIGGLATGALPGAGTALSTGVLVAALWGMYLDLSNKLNVVFNKNIWKVIASAVIANVINNLLGEIAVRIILGFVPGLSIAAAGLFNFASLYVAGMIFLKAMSMVFKVGVNPNDMTSDQLKEQFGNAAKTVDIKQTFSEAKGTFKQMNKDGSLKAMGKDVDLRQYQDQLDPDDLKDVEKAGEALNRSMQQDNLCCPNCGNSIQMGQKFCAECGTALNFDCPNCHTPLVPGAKFCPECGQKVS